ncbi:carbon starvation induced protein CsiD [Leeia sp. TBRC 13508]|uniref:Carbon starvation induced protein CsiD n=1 Tax=Leeia speluncae TaxID=2884804 RepID=A0ABS8D8W9_9NEIS|nr:glutarate dioxygenase GlaH [Leeia speluncae]MCB6184391.1 carbon starvation induced protein CsiD [Leeia speluncae]
MNAINKQEIQSKDHLHTGNRYQISAHPHHHRLYQVELNTEALTLFIERTAHISSQNLEYIPYMRFVIASILAELVDTDFKRRLRAIIHDRESGGFTIGLQESSIDKEVYIKFGTAISHLIGTANFDAMSGTYYARFLVKDTDTSDSYLRQAYRLFTLHTDGTFVDEPTDWLLMMKFEELNASGGESRLLHLDDWEDLPTYSQHPLASYEFTYKAPPSKNVQQSIQRRTFFLQNDKPCICFIDQFVCPETIEHATWLKNLSDSMENAPETRAMPLPVGQLVMINNAFWLHGRAAFEKHPELHRELMRQRGTFSNH